MPSADEHGEFAPPLEHGRQLRAGDAQQHDEQDDAADEARRRPRPARSGLRAPAPAPSASAPRRRERRARPASACGRASACAIVVEHERHFARARQSRQALQVLERDLADRSRRRPRCRWPRCRRCGTSRSRCRRPARPSVARISSSTLGATADRRSPCRPRARRSRRRCR